MSQAIFSSVSSFRVIVFSSASLDSQLIQSIKTAKLIDFYTNVIDNLANLDHTKIKPD